MKKKTLYQTVEDRDNPDYVERHGPFKCNWNNTWLGDGYYFWDTFIENAHWWGGVRYKNSYMICEATCDFNSSLCFDLVGETDHMLDFSKSLDYLREKGLIDRQTTVARVLFHLRNKIPGGFNFEAIRVYGIKSISEHKEEYQKYRYTFPLEISKPQYIDYKPAIQICIFNRKGLNLGEIKIIYPDEYNFDYVI